jgi:hypothetical protein
MAFRNLAAATLLLFSTPAMADAVRVDEPPAPPMAFYVAKGAPDACGPGCDTWIAVEGHIDVGATFRFEKFLRQQKDRDLPLYFSSSGGDLDEALAMGNVLRERRAVARVARTVVGECGFEAQDGDVCFKLKRSDRELYATLSTRGARCNSACPYFMLGAATREIAPDVVIGIHSPKVVLRFTGGTPTEQLRTSATERGIDRADKMLSSYFAKMGIAHELLDLAKTIKFEDMHVLTREELIRFGIDRREFVETPWVFESTGRTMVRKSAVAKRDSENSYRLLQWRLFCLNNGQFELHFHRQVAAAPGFGMVSISSGGPKPLNFTFPPAKPAGFEIWRLRTTRASVRAMADLPQLDLMETGFAADGRRLTHPEKLSTEGLAASLASLLTTCPPPKDVVPMQQTMPQDRAAK